MQDNVAIKVSNASKLFKLPHERHTSIKSAVLNFYKRKKTYELQKALKGINLEIKKGEFFGIVGRNGSGKSTLLKLLAEIYSPDTGAIQINGKLTPFIELGVGFNPELTGRENVYLNGALLGFSQKEMEAMYQDIVDFAEIERFMDQKLKNYSSGMQVRLAFSIAIRAQSDILLIDEVLAVGDAAFQRKCFSYFEELKKNKKTVVIVSHDMNAIERFCTRAALISKGNLDFVGSPEQVSKLYKKQNASDIKLSDNTDTIDTGAKITKLSILGSQKNEFTLKEIICLEFNITTEKPIKVAPGINITRDDGQFIVGLTCHAQVKPKITEAGINTVFTISFPARQFIRGTYSVDGVVYDSTDPQPVFYKPSMASFTITEDEQSWGVFNLDCEWKRKD
ncbi:ABC transporter ATP-binding protein [Candidatus Saccharibacteria bacterium]|nr:ABC transporter ATP-binding protein [Candidatus Saccharibacteria bacterium]